MKIITALALILLGFICIAQDRQIQTLTDEAINPYDRICQTHHDKNATSSHPIAGGSIMGRGFRKDSVLVQCGR